MDYFALRALDAEHSAGMSPEVAAEHLLTLTRTERRLVPLWQIKKHGMENGWWSPVKQAASTNQAAAALMEYYSDMRFENIDLDLPATEQVIGGLVQSEVLTQPQADAIDAMASAVVPLVADAGFATITPSQIRRVRSMEPYGR